MDVSSPIKNSIHCQKTSRQLIEAAACEAYLSARNAFLKVEIGMEWRYLKAMLDKIDRQTKLAMLQALLKPGTEITLQITDEWLDTLLMFNPGVLSEAQRLKERLSQIPFHAKRAADEGENYWLRSAQSYAGD
jgi:hypothetical protein